MFPSGIYANPYAELHNKMYHLVPPEKLKKPRGKNLIWYSVERMDVPAIFRQSRDFSQFKTQFLSDTNKLKQLCKKHLPDREITLVDKISSFEVRAFSSTTFSPSELRAIYTDTREDIHQILQIINSETLSKSFIADNLDQLISDIDLCANGVVSNCQNVRKVMMFEYLGLEGKLQQTREKLAEEAILLFIRKHHTYKRNYEIHFVNVYLITTELTS